VSRLIKYIRLYHHPNQYGLRCAHDDDRRYAGAIFEEWLLLYTEEVDLYIYIRIQMLRSNEPCYCADMWTEHILSIKKGIADKIGCVIQYPCANISKTNTIRYCKLLLALLTGHMQRSHREEKMLQLTHNLTKNKIQMICCLHRGKSPSIKNGIPQIKKDILCCYS